MGQIIWNLLKLAQSLLRDVIPFTFKEKILNIFYQRSVARPSRVAGKVLLKMKNRLKLVQEPLRWKSRCLFWLEGYLGLGLVRNWVEYATHGGAGDDNIHDYNHDTHVMMKCVCHEKCSLSVQPSTAQFSTVQHTTAQYSRVQPNQIVWYEGLWKMS